MAYGRRKYGNKPTVVDGITFASKREALYYGDLKLLERAGKISDLELQPRFKLSINGMKICTYVADFSYFCENKRRVIDVKGMQTPVFKLKMKLMAALYPGVTVDLVK